MPAPRRSPIEALGGRRVVLIAVFAMLVVVVVSAILVPPAKPDPNSAGSLRVQAVDRANDAVKVAGGSWVAYPSKVPWAAARGQVQLPDRCPARSGFAQWNFLLEGAGLSDPKADISKVEQHWKRLGYAVSVPFAGGIVAKPPNGKGAELIYTANTRVSTIQVFSGCFVN